MVRSIESVLVMDKTLLSLSLYFDPKHYIKFIDRETEAKFSYKKSFIMVLDKSGSMQGTPWRQVQEALIKMLRITNADARINVKAMAYNHSATLLDITGDINIDTKNIQGMRSGGKMLLINVKYFRYCAIRHS